MIEEEAREYLATRRESTLMVGFTRKGERQIMALRSPDATQAPVPEAEHIYEIGSISKIYTTTILAVLEDQGLLSREDPIGAHLPLQLAPHIASITIRQLATHSAGLPSVGKLHQALIAEESRGTEPPFGAYTHYLRYRKQHLYADLESAELAYPTGQGWLYSIIGMGTLGHILELVTKRPYEDLLREIICEPLGLTSTGYTLTPEQLGRVMYAYDAEGQPCPNWYHDVLLPQGGLRSSMNDMLTFAEAHLKAATEPDGSQLSRAMRLTQEQHFVSAPGMELPEPLSNPWREQVIQGLAWRKLEQPLGQACWHPGTTLFYHSGLAVDPVSQVGAVMLSSDRKTLAQMQILSGLFLPWFREACRESDPAHPPADRPLSTA